jgi:hypothetical protein
MDMLKALLASNPGVEVTPQTLLQFIAARTKHSPRESPQSSPNDSDQGLPGDRGRTEERNGDGTSRSSSNESSGSSYTRPTGSRRPSRGPPQTPKGPSPFDASKRQRSVPLGNNAPSSWTKPPAPHHRRRSDAGLGRSSSDSEVRSFFIIDRAGFDLFYLVILSKSQCFQRTYVSSRPCPFQSHISNEATYLGWRLLLPTPTSLSSPLSRQFPAQEP